MLDDLQAASRDDIVEALSPEVFGVNVESSAEFAAEALDNISDAASEFADREKVDDVLTEALQSEQVQDYATEKIEQGIDEITQGITDFFSGWGW